MQSSVLIEERSQLLREHIEEVFELGKQRLLAKGVDVNAINTIREIMLAIADVPQEVHYGNGNFQINDFFESFYDTIPNINVVHQTHSSRSAADWFELLYDTVIAKGGYSTFQDLASEMYDTQAIITTTVQTVLPPVEITEYLDAVYDSCSVVMTV